MTAPDSDQDGVPVTDANCTWLPNPGQCDSDGDLSNNGITNAEDGVVLRNLLGAGTPGPWFNIGDVNAQDMTLFRHMLG